MTFSLYVLIFTYTGKGGETTKINIYFIDGSKIKVSNDATIEGTRLSDTAFTSFFEFLSYNIRNLDTTSFLHIENKNRIYEINVNQICYIENVTEKPDDYL